MDLDSNVENVHSHTYVVPCEVGSCQTWALHNQRGGVSN